MFSDGCDRINSHALNGPRNSRPEGDCQTVEVRYGVVHPAFFSSAIQSSGRWVVGFKLLFLGPEQRVKLIQRNVELRLNIVQRLMEGSSRGLVQLFVFGSGVGCHTRQRTLNRCYIRQNIDLSGGGYSGRSWGVDAEFVGGGIRLRGRWRCWWTGFYWCH